MSNIQCAQCNNSPACNADSFFESQLFCLEKDGRKWKENKGKSVCEIGFCFIAVDKNELGLVQGCGKCSDQQNLTKCSNCSAPLCNTETILPPPIKCHHPNINFQPYIKRNKTCHHVYDSCYIAWDVFWRG
uniref:Apple domain-containing protein n=1 Tax=Meloidogyne hapla TaxID=6305 RepID=A0A1I8BBQ8_MELHA